MTDSTQIETVFDYMVVNINSQMEPEEVVSLYGHLTIKKLLEDYSDDNDSDNDWFLNSKKLSNIEVYIKKLA